MTEISRRKACQPGDAILVSGDVGRHGMAIMAVREGLQFESAIESDSAPVHEIVLELLEAGIEIHCLRDLTRGGLASALNEIAEAARVRIEVEEKLIPVREDVHAACEMLGLDPLHVACEGRFVAFVAAKDAERALKIMCGHPTGVGELQEVHWRPAGCLAVAIWYTGLDCMSRAEAS